MTVGDAKWPNIIKSEKCVGKGLPTFPHLPFLFFLPSALMFTLDTAITVFLHKKGGVNNSH